MSQTTKVSGVGARRSFAWLLNDDGLPLPEESTAVPYEGEEIEGIKTFDPVEGAVRRFTHTGEDVAMAVQTMPTLEQDTLQITTGKANLALDAFFSKSKVREYTNLKMRVGGGSTRGDEAYVMAMSYQQAVDTAKTSPTFGRLAYWRGYLVPIAQFTDQPMAMNENIVDKVYQGIMPPFFDLPWLEALDEANWGKEQGNYIELISRQQPFINTYRGDGSRLMFLLSKSPVDDQHLLVWVESDGVGSLVTPDTVVTGATPSFTLDAGDMPAEDALVLAFIQTDRPGQRVNYGAAPAAPTLDTPADAAVVTDATPDLAWLAVTGATAYRIQIAPDNPFLAPVQDAIVTAPTLVYTATTLTEDAQFWWRVRAVNQWGEGSWSAARSFTVNAV